MHEQELCQPPRVVFRACRGAGACELPVGRRPLEPLAGFLNLHGDIDGNQQDTKKIATVRCGVSRIMAKHPPPLRVLVVDDEPLIRWALVETLEDSGHQAVEAGDARTAIQALLTAAAPFDVVLLDLRLPDASGLAVLAQARRRSADTQVILMTAYGTPEVVEDARDLGAFRVVPKPLEMDDLSDLVLEAYAASL